MIDRIRIDAITREDVERLQLNEVREGRTIEYKLELPGSTDDQRKEFLGDVSSFANAGGGDLVYGVREERGVPTAIKGVRVNDEDVTLQRLENMLRDGLAPRIQGIRFKWIVGFGDGPVLVIRVPRGWLGPHMVIFKNGSRFFSRNSSGKYQFDVAELRQAFLLSASLIERLKDIRAERVGRLVAGETPYPLAGSRMVAVQVVPHASLVESVEIDLQQLSLLSTEVNPLYADTAYRTFNLDGFLTYSLEDRTSAFTYLQVFRNGVVESATTATVSSVVDGRPMVAGTSLAMMLFFFVEQMERLYKALHIEPPLTVFITLIGIAGVTLAIPESIRFNRSVEPRPFDRSVLSLPDLLIERFDVPPQQTLRPALDALWQSAGIRSCLHYDKDGNWKNL